ncbi:prolyl oligopeptidase family-domain-containing protein [Chlamydoabsidia padenii]|nr:prolyl oligopeptidase family-domain-containing protein [Chlamydoabsidia padenii]
MANTQLRPCKVFAHRIGTEQAEDILIYEETESTAFVDITSTKDSKYITINSNSLSSSEIRVVDATLVPHNTDRALLNPVLIEPRQSGVEYYVDHHQDSFYILTNADGATNFKLVKAPDGATGRSNWKDVVTMAPTEKIEDVDLFQNHIVIYGRRDGLPVILCHDLKTQDTYQVDLPMKFAVVAPGSNLEFDTDTFRFSLTSPFTHESTYEYNMMERKLTPVRVQPIRRKNPVLMRSYGAYGVTTDPEFRIEHFPLLERGWVIALAHVRFKDFISVAEHLVTTNLTSPAYLAAMGTSAGGLLVGGMAHMRPDLFKALVLRVPFVDPLSSMLNPDLPLTQIEYPEWGNPTDHPMAYDWIRQYAPYDNVTKTTDVAIYATAGMKDQRVMYWQPLKYIARLRHVGTKTCLLKVDLDRGHFGGQSEQETRLADTAEQVAFLITQVQTS